MEMAVFVCPPLHFHLGLYVNFATTAPTDTHAAVSSEWPIWDTESVGGREMEVNESAVLLYQQ